MTLPAIVFEVFLCLCVHTHSCQGFYITETDFLTLKHTVWVKNDFVSQVFHIPLMLKNTILCVVFKRSACCSFFKFHHCLLSGVFWST